MKSSVELKMFLVCLVAINLMLTATTQEVRAEIAASPSPSTQCVQRKVLRFNGVGLWERLPAVFERYGQPLRIEPMYSINKDRVNAIYFYRDIKLLIFNSIVWQINLLTPDIYTTAGIRLSGDFTEIEKMLGVKLKKTAAGQSKNAKYKVPICPPDPPEVEEYVILDFDDNKRLVEFTVQGVFP